MSTPIDSLVAMSANGRAALKRPKEEGGAGLQFLEEAAELSDAVLLNLPGFGPHSLQRLRFWQENPTAQQPTNLTDRVREERAFAIYQTLLASRPGITHQDAARNALDAVDDLTKRLREPAP